MIAVLPRTSLYAWRNFVGSRPSACGANVKRCGDIPREKRKAIVRSLMRGTLGVAAAPRLRLLAVVRGDELRARRSDHRGAIVIVVFVCLRGPDDLTIGVSAAAGRRALIIGVTLILVVFASIYLSMSRPTRRRSTNAEPHRRDVPDDDDTFDSWLR